MKNEKLKKIIFGVVTISIVNLFCSVATFADWVQVGDKWQYSTGGDVVREDFKLIDGSYYYFDYDGNMVTGVQEIETELYAFGSDGKAMKDGITLFGENYKCSLKGKLLKVDELDKTADECNAWILSNNKRNEVKEYHEAVDNVLSQQLSVRQDGEVIGWNKIGAEYRIVNNSGKKYAHDYADINEVTQLTNTVYFDDNGNIRPLKWIKFDDRLQLVVEAGQAEYYKQSVYINGVPCSYNLLDKTISKENYNQLLSKGFDENVYGELVKMDLEATYQRELQLVANQKQKELLEQQKRQKEYEIQSIRWFAGYRKTANGSSIPVIEGQDAEIINPLIGDKYIGLIVQYVLDYYESEFLDANVDNLVITTSNVSIWNYEDGQMDMIVTVKALSKTLNVHLVYDPIKKDFIYTVDK